MFFDKADENNFCLNHSTNFPSNSSMAKATNQSIIVETAKQLLKKKSGGLRFAELLRAIEKQLPAMPHGTIAGTLCKLDQDEMITKPEKGLFSLLDEDIDETRPSKKTGGKNNQLEKQFYEPFAEWLVNELDDCTKARAIGGNIFRGKWETPDVMGVKKTQDSDIVKFPTQLISAEIKTDYNGLVTAFGQACSYKLFSHKSYLVIPKDSGESDLSRLDSLCMLHGIGLIHFNKNKPDSPDFQIRCRAIHHDPDLFYTNRYARILDEHRMLFD